MIKIFPIFSLSLIFDDLGQGTSGFLSHTHISTAVLDAEHVYLKLQVTIFKIKEITTNPKLQTLEGNKYFENP